VKTEVGPGGTITYGYNAAGRLASMTPPGQSAVTYAYDADGRLMTETQGSLTATFSYDADGRLSAETMPDGITADYAYAAGELTEIDYWKGASTLVGNVTYGYDVNGQRVAEGGTLVHAVLPTAQSGSTYNADNQLTSFGGKTYSYDADGNLLSDGTNTYTWNARNQLISVSGPSGTSTLGYDPLGRQVATTVGGVTTTFAYQESQLISEKGSNGTNAAFLNGPDGPLARIDNSTAGAGAVQSYLPDALDSTLALVTSAGQIAASYSYDLFGNATSSVSGDANPLRYTGLISGSVMPAGLQDNGARDYSPATGQFISADPTGASGSGDNLYAYAGGDPVDNSDPTGLQWQILAVACVLGGAANDIGGALDGQKHSAGDFFAGAALGCVSGALMTIDGAGEALDALEGGDEAISGLSGSEDLSGLGEDLSGDGTSDDGGGADSCTTTPNSLAADTKVELASGRTEPISKLKPGDEVKAADPATGKTTSEPVLAVIRGHGSRHLTRITVTRTFHGRQITGTIVATANHSFWDVTRRAWIEAGSLRGGDRLFTPGHQRVAVAAAQDHTYYVHAADENLLVHNCSARPGRGVPLTDGQAEQMAKRVGYRWTRFTSSGQRVFTNGKTFISQDITSHSGGLWKMARTVKDLGSKTTRMGTYDLDLNYIGP
jgi:RHS repeat-associated protein